MIDRGQRLVLLAENHAGAAPWYQLAYERLTEETPFHFGTAAALLGPPETHLRAAPRPEAARRSSSSTTGSRPRPCSDPATPRKVNAYGPLLAPRRGVHADPRSPAEPAGGQLLQEGDVFRVADRLNRVPDR